METIHCTRHDHPRPCPGCARAGYGGAGRGQGRKAEFRRPVRVQVMLEEQELSQALERWPDRTRSAAIRAALLEALMEAPPQIEERPPQKSEPAPAPAVIPPSRSFSLTWQEVKLVRHVLYELHGFGDPDVKLKAIRHQLAVIGANDWDADLPLEQCRLLRRELKAFLDSSKERLAQKMEYAERHFRKALAEWKRRRKRGTSPLPLETRIATIRREHRAENGKVRNVREKIPWQ